MHLRDSPSIAALAIQCITATSATTYQTGRKHFTKFLSLESIGLLDLLNASKAELHYVAESFTLYLSEIILPTGLPLMNNTVNSYISHTIFYLISVGVIEESSDFRCPTTSRLIQAIKQRDGQIRLPLRMRVSIAVNLSMIHTCIGIAQTHFSCPITIAFVTAAFYIGFAFSLRPGDYLIPIADDFHRCRGMQFAFWFSGNDQPCFLHQPWTFPPYGTKPRRMSFLPDKDKANKMGQLGMRACAANPDLTSPCFIQYLLEFFRKFPPKDEFDALFGALPPPLNSSAQFLYTSVRQILSLTAVQLGVNINQLLPRGLRAGASAHIRGTNGMKDDCKQSGGWHSDAFEIYQRPDFSVSDRCGEAMHNVTAVDNNMVRYVHSTSGPLPLPKLR